VNAAPEVAVIAGGVGAARLLRGMLMAVDPSQVAAIVNTGDDTELHGLSIAPDLDTITYTLAGAIDPERGWGLAGETWNAMEALRRYGDVRPPTSTAGGTWFALGDHDLATHLYRTARRAERATLTEITAEIAAAWSLECTLLPMTDGRCRTMLRRADSGEWIPFQTYFVGLRHSVAVSEIAFEQDQARPTDAVMTALRDARTIVIAPSNPLVSIAPIRSLPGIDDVLVGRRDRVVAVSPIAGGVALKGPADRMLTELGFQPTVVGVAELYRTIASVLVIDHVDAALAPAVEALGMRCVVTSTVMTSIDVSTDLSRTCLAAPG
jgi:LPPG:FO 2-phospho-L-lactate transferase